MSVETHNPGIFQRMLAFVIDVVRFMDAWRRSRLAAEFWQGSLVMAIVAVFTTLMIAGLVIRDSKTVKTYRAAADSALAAEDTQAAELWYRKLIYFDTDNKAAHFGLAQVARLEDDIIRERAIIDQLAPEDATGFADAHYWKARYLLTQRKSPSDHSQAILNHATKAVTGNPANQAAQELLGRIYLAGGQYEQALKHMTQAADANPAVRLAIAHTYQVLGSNDGTHKAKVISEADRAAMHYRKLFEADDDRTDARIGYAKARTLQGQYFDALKTLTSEIDRLEALPADNQRSRMLQVNTELTLLYRRWYGVIHSSGKEESNTPAESSQQLELQEYRRLAVLESKSAADYFKRRVKTSPLSSNVRTRFAELFLLHDQFKDAIKILEAGIQSSNNSQLERSILNVYQQWHRHLIKQDRPATERLKILQRLLELSPTSEFALSQVSLLSGESDSALSEQALKTALANGNAPATVHLILGSSAIQKKQLDKAAFHLEQAYRMNPKLPSLQNNLAWVLMNQASPDYERALRLANDAVNGDGNNAEYRETRGQVFVKLKRWKDGLADLEFALQQLGSRPEIHRALAVAYEELGDRELSNVHRSKLHAAENSSNN